MNELTSKWIDEHKNELIETLKKTVSFRSVRDDSTACEGAPFGKTPSECLDYVLSTAASFGFSVKNMDGYCGTIDFGSGEEQLGILSHLDVVPEGNGWKYPPYAGEIHDGFLYGRGVLDDKGPGIAALYALAAIKECGFETKRRIRIILGCDEECGMGCLTHYLENEPAPDLAFSPDAEYPLINSEKMIYNAKYAKNYPSEIKLTCGTVSNAVPGEAEFFVPVSDEIVRTVVSEAFPAGPFTFEVSKAAGGSDVHITGLAAHASTPELGNNAFYAALDLMSRLPLDGEDRKTVTELAGLFGYQLHGENFGIDSEDASGRLTMNIGVVNWDENGIRLLTVDIRAPIVSDGEFITEKLRNGFSKAGMTELEHSWSDGYYVSPESELVSTLIGIYNKEFNTNAAPMAIGGGTYARHLKNAVAFGPERPGELACIHMANECVNIDHLIQDAKIYADAIIALACK